MNNPDHIPDPQHWIRQHVGFPLHILIDLDFFSEFFPDEVMIFLFLRVFSYLLYSACLAEDYVV